MPANGRCDLIRRLKVKVPNVKFQGNPDGGSRADIRGQTKLISAFRDYANVPKKSWLKKIIIIIFLERYPPSVTHWINNSDHPKGKWVTLVLHLDATFRIDPSLLYCVHFMDTYSDKEQDTFDTGPHHCKTYMKLSESTKRRELSLPMSLATFLTRHPSTCINMSHSTKLKMLNTCSFYIRYVCV